MAYLLIIVIVALLGIFRLWVQQRRSRAHLDTVDVFRESLDVLSEQSSSHRPARLHAGRSRPATTRSHRHPAPLDPARRAAAKKRLEARRQAKAHGSWLVSS